MEIRTIDDYMEQFPDDVKVILQNVRAVIRENAPEATEKISWKMPTFYLGGNLIHFAAHKNHLGIYPGPEAIEFFEPKLTDYPNSKGAIQFAYGKTIPYDLIGEIVRYRVMKTCEERVSDV